MSTNMQTPLNIPSNFPEWATSGTASIVEPPQERKDIGWEVDDEIPAAFWNWWNNITYQWTKRVGAMVPSNFFLNDAVSGTPLLRAILYHPDVGQFIALEDVASPTSGFSYHSIDGQRWGGTFRSYVGIDSSYAAGIDATKYLVGLKNGSLDYTLTGSSWLNISSATVGGGTGPIRALITRYPTTNYIMVAKDTGVRIATDALSTWYAATTQPTYAGTPRAFVRVVGGAEGQTWRLWSSQSISPYNRIHESIDDGVTWVDTGEEPSLSAFRANSYAYDITAGRYLAGGFDGTETRIAYDEGSGWAYSDIDWGSLDPSVSQIHHLYDCGSGIWLAIGDGDTQDIAQRTVGLVLVSVDGGLSWKRSHLNGTSGLSSEQNMYAVACDGTKLVLVGDGGYTAHSLNVAL